MAGARIVGARMVGVWMLGVLCILGATTGAMAAPQPPTPAISKRPMAATAPPILGNPIQLADATVRERRSHAGEQGVGRDRRSGEHARESREQRPKHEQRSKHEQGQTGARQEHPDSRGSSRPPGQERSGQPPRPIKEQRSVDKGHRQFDNLSPQQQQRIREARERFQQLSPEERARLRQKWHALPPEERRRWSDPQGHGD